MSDPLEGLRRWHVVVLVEGSAVAIALVMPVTPSKFGGDGSVAELFFDAQGYVAEVLVNFVLVHLVLALFGGLLVLLVWWDRRGD